MAASMRDIFLSQACTSTSFGLPERKLLAMFEPIHGCAFDIAGKRIAGHGQNRETAQPRGICDYVRR
jgi:hypothetical protein